MKFLPKDETYNEIVPLNFIYSNAHDFSQDDVLTIIYKDIVTNQKKVYHITNPEIEVYIVKPEYRDFTHYRDWFPESKCDAVKVHYRTRYYELGRKMGISTDEVKQSQYIFGADIDIENYYLINFVLEYGTDKKPQLSCGFLDIENDIIRCEGFPKYGETPINIVTFIDGPTKNAFTFILEKDDLENETDKESIELRKKFYEQVDWFKTHQDEVQKKVHEMFDEFYGNDFVYNFIMCKSEIELMRSLWKVIHACENDFVYVWNLPYDMSNLMIRPNKFNCNPNEIIPDPRINPRFPIEFVEDNNPVAHKRKHICKTFTLPQFIDQMVIYAGIRSGRGKLPSLKLNSIAKNLLQEEKLDYSETADLKHLFYVDFLMAVIYNLKDVLLQYGIERKTRDIDTIFGRIYDNMTLPHQAFTTTLTVKYAFTKFINERHYQLGVNRNKFIDNTNNNYGLALSELGDSEDDDIDLSEFTLDDDESQESSTKKKKYAGAYVMNPLYMSPTGTKILGKDSKYVHEFVGDEDIGSEYPTACTTANISNETLVGKVIINEVSDIEIPLYDDFEFLGNERSKYLYDKSKAEMNKDAWQKYQYAVSTFMLDTYNEQQYVEMGRIFLNLPNVSDIIAIIDENIDDYILK